MPDPVRRTDSVRRTAATADARRTDPAENPTAPSAPAAVRELQRVTVFSGSAMGHSPAFAQGAAELAGAIAAAGIGVVYGGGRVGLMGTVADAARAAGGEVHGVIPQALMDKEVGHPGLSELDIVPDMHTRKQRMAELGDAFVALPGGVGTLEELFEVWTWQQLGYHAKPVALFDIEGYWQPLIAAVDSMAGAGFLSDRFRSALIVADEPQALIEALRTWQAPEAKWSRAEDLSEAEGLPAEAAENQVRHSEAEHDGEALSEASPDGGTER